MEPRSLSAPALVSEPAALRDLVERLRAEPLVALDTESNSFHVYRERVCLLQVSSRDADFVVDPLAVDPAPLAEVLCDGREVVLHGADYDVRCLKREYGWRFPRLFDTMAAARRLGRSGLSLSALVEGSFGQQLAKEHQRSDWGRRPLSQEQLRYAALDTHFLLELHAELSGELTQRGLLEEARREFERIAAVEPRAKVFDPEGWRKLKGARELTPEGKSVLKALYAAREEAASAADRPPFKVMAEQAMLEIARRLPRGPEEVARVPGVTPHVLRRMGASIEAALRAVR
ncbi:MAG TPA: ribonuclease D [Anaeromyxobacteraceae bacterium]|jgi:ribonuclease D|nr:ribonuclease D [Anaeromyxobacteraceae bacterium]